MKKKGQKIYFAVIMAFLYLPLIYLIAYSFNDGKTSVWKGFTMKWYTALFNDSQIMTSLYNTLIIALLGQLMNLIAEGLDSGFESFGWLLLYLVCAIKLVGKEERI